MENFSIQKDGSFIVSDKKSIYKYSLNLLEVIVCDKPYLELHVQNRVFLIKRSIKSITDTLPSFFIQVSRKDLVNVHFIESITIKDNQYFLQTIQGKTLEVSQRRYNQVLSVVKKHIELNTILLT